MGKSPEETDLQSGKGLENVFRPAETPAGAAEHIRSDISEAFGANKIDTAEKPSVTETLKHDFAGIADVSSLSLPGFEGKEVFRIKVKDKEKWASEEELRKLSKTFLEVAFYGYKDRDDKTEFREDDPEFVETSFKENMIGTDLSLSDDIIGVAENGKLQGFISFSGYELEDGSKADKLMLTAVHPSQEGRTDLSKKLYKAAFENLESDYLIGASHTPSAIKNRISVAEQNGWQTYYSGYRNGDEGAEMTDNEKKLLEMAENAIKKDCANDPDLMDFQEGLPPHYISYGDLGIPPRKLKELRFKAGEASLHETMEDLVTWQMDNRPEHCIYGILVSIRKSKF
jgi:hypothetical protein